MSKTIYNAFLILLATLVFAPINNGYSQPYLVPAFPVQQYSELTLSQLGKLKRILSLEVDSGAIIYDRKYDKWHLYNAVHEYKKYGPLREIVQCGNLNFCRLDSAVLVSKNTKIINIITGRFGALTVDCDNVYFIPIKSQIYQDTITPQIVKINAKTGIYRKYEYPEQFIGDKVISTAIYGNKIWISFRASSECGEDWESCVVLDDVGEKNKIKPKRLPWHLARLIIPSDTALFVSTMDGLYKVTEHDSLLKVVAYKITMDAQQLIDKKRIVLRNYIDYFTQKNLWLLDIENKSLEEVSLKSGWADNDRSCFQAVAEGRWLYLLATQNTYCIRFDLKRENKPLKYPIRDGPVSSIRYFCEDEKEAWFTLSNDVICRFNKKDSTWIVYSQFGGLDTVFIEGKPDPDPMKTMNSPGQIRLHLGQIALNKDLVVITRDDQYGYPHEYVIYDRHKNDFEIIGETDLFNRFLSNSPIKINRGRIERNLYKNSRSYSDANLCNMKSIWCSLVFMKDLTLTGIGYDFKNRFIRTSKYLLFSDHVYENPNNWRDLIYKKDYTGGQIYTYKLPQKADSLYRSDFILTPSLPFYITGNDSIVWGIGHGLSSRGIFKYNLYNGEYTVIGTEYLSFVYIGQTDSSIIVGYDYLDQRALSINKNSADFATFTKPAGYPLSMYSGKTYVYMGSLQGLEYYDKPLKKKMTLRREWSELIDSGFDIYVKCESNLFRLIE